MIVASESAPACVRTERGAVPFAAVAVGDHVVTASGGLAPVRWLGWRRVVFRRAGAAALRPVRIPAGAIGPGLPQCDVLVSPGQHVAVGGALVAAGLLAGHGAVRTEAAGEAVTYRHLGLPYHEVVAVAGLACEMWLEAADRTWFSNGPVARCSLREPAAGSAYRSLAVDMPVVTGGPMLAAARRRLARPVAAAARTERPG